MKKIISRKPLCFAICAILALSAVFETNTTTIYAAPDEESTLAVSHVGASSLRDELSKNGNVVTEYVNDEDKQLKTIIWAKGIEPPIMGGKDSQFEKRITYDSNKNPDYIEYIAPYIPGKGWYDVNKSKNFVQLDMNLCFAAAASNSLHWWMDRNSQYIDKYLEMNPQDPQIQKIKSLRSSFENQQKSGVYDIFLHQFANKQDGYWPDILQDQFINGYYLKPNGGTNDSPADRDKLLSKGPDKNGGFFFNVFEENRLTQRRHYGNGFDAINRELKELFINGDSVLLAYSMGVKSHVVTLWGVEFDQNGTVCAVYYSDSDDEHSQGMMRYRLVNVGGKAIVTTKVDGTGNSVVESLQVLSQGTKQWENYFRGPKKTLDLVWKDTELVYNGKVQAPTVSATNIDKGDDVVLSVEGGKVNVGDYTATVTISGPAADKYRLPAQRNHSFKIKKAPAPQITFPSASTIQYGQKLSDSVLVGPSDQYGSFSWEDAKTVPQVGQSSYMVKFVPSKLTQQNYEPVQSSSELVSVVVEKATPTVTVNANVNNDGSSKTVTLFATLNSVGYGEIPTGTVTFEVTGENGDVLIDSATDVAIENGLAAAIWNGASDETYTVKANYSGSKNYNSISSDEILVDVHKLSQDLFEIKPIGTKTYGDKDFVVLVVGGSGNGEETFESSDPDIISFSGSTATIGKAGTTTITATKAGDDIYNEAKASLQVVINKKELIVTAENKLDVIQGDLMPNFTYKVEGLVNGDQFEDPILTVLHEDTNTPGDYEIFIYGGNLTNKENYIVTYVNGKLSIKAKELHPDPNPNPRPHPTPNPSPDPTPSPMPSEKLDEETPNQPIEEEVVENKELVVDAKPGQKPVNNVTKSTFTESQEPPSDSEPTEPLENSVTTEAQLTTEEDEKPSSDKSNKTMVKVIVGTIATLSAVAIVGVPMFFKRYN